MNAEKAKEILDKVFGSVFGFQNPYSLEEARQKFAFDLRLPQKVYDATTNEPTWAFSVNPSKFVTLENSKLHDEWATMEPRPLNSMEDIFTAWAETNLTTSGRMIDSFNVAESDLVYGSENVFRSSAVKQSKNIIFTEDISESEFIVAGSRSQTSSFCIRVEDSQLTSNSFNVIWSAKITNSFFIQDCFDLMDCMFCSHIAGKRFCIANMQYSEEEYTRIKQMVIKWIISN
jgi:hypothetical protein